MNQEALAGIYNYRAVDGQLATSGQPSVEQLGAIAGAGFTTVVNLALHDDPRYSLTDEPGAVSVIPKAELAMDLAQEWVRREMPRAVLL